MSVETVISEGIAEIILDCPPVNALTSSEWLDLAINIDNLAHNNDVRVIVISAKGNGFCAGADIKELQEDPSKIRFMFLLTINKKIYSIISIK